MLRMSFDQLKERLINGQCGPDLEMILSKINNPCELKAPITPPTWLDDNLFQIGTKFFWEYYFAVALSSLQSLLIGMSIPNLW